MIEPSTDAEYLRKVILPNPELGAVWERWQKRYTPGTSQAVVLADFIDDLMEAGCGAT